MAQVKERGGAGKKGRKRLQTLGTRGFSRVRREFLVLAEGRSHERRSAGHYKDLAETGNRARKVSGTQGNKPRDFENRPLGLSCLSERTDI